MRNLFIAAVLAGSLVACTLYFGDDPTQTGTEDRSADLSDRGRGHGHHRRDAGTDGTPESDAGFFPDGGPGADAGGLPDGGVFPDGGPGADAGLFPDGAPSSDAGFFPDGAPPAPDAGTFPDGRPD